MRVLILCGAKQKSVLCRMLLCIYLHLRNLMFFLISKFSFVKSSMDSIFCDFDSEEDEVDEISQMMLREQLGQMPLEEFVLPAHIKLSIGTVERQSEFPSTDNSVDDYYMDNFSDEQEEIKVMEAPLLVEIPDEIDTPTHSFDYYPRLSSTEIEILDEVPITIKPIKPRLKRKKKEALSAYNQQQPVHDELMQNENSLVGSFDQQKQPLELSQMHPLTKNSTALKRRRRPTMNADEFVYTPLTKMRMAIKNMEEKIVEKRKYRPRQRQQKSEKRLERIEMIRKISEKVASKKEARAKERNEKQMQRLSLIKKIKEKSAAKEKKAKERSEKQLQRLEFIRRMTHLRHLNPLACQSRGASFYEEDYFYREILVSSSNSEATNTELDVDCITVSVPPGGFDELFVINPAESCATSMSKMLSGKNKAFSFEEGDINSEESYEKLDLDIRTFLDIFLKFVDDQRLVDLTTQGVSGGVSMFHNLTMKNANRLRESLRLYSKSNLLHIVHVHGWLLKNLGQTRLTSYLNLLRYLKNAGSGLSDYITSSSSAERDVAEANKCISEFIAQKLYEPPLSSSSKFFECEPIKNVSLVLVYPQINAKTGQHIIRAHETLFRNLLPLAVCCVEKIELNLNVDRPVSVEECTWMCIRMIRQRVKEIAKRRQNDHIFLAGWGTTCWLNHKAVSKVSNVSGLLDFAFPTESPCGSRGSVDDQICLTYPATLFVVGEEAHNVRMQALRQLRKNMIADSGLVVIGNANHNLLVSPTMLSIERISQFIVQKNIVEYVIQFIKQVVADLGLPKECRQFLKPIKLPNIYEVDPAFFKAKPTTGPNRPRKIAEKKEAEEKEDKLRKERKILEPPLQKMPFRHPTKIAGNLPSQLQPTAPAAASLKYGTLLHSARHSFNLSLKSASVDNDSRLMAEPLKIPSPETLNRQIPPLLQTARVPTMPPSSSSAFQETLREEEEAAAALAALK